MSEKTLGEAIREIRERRCLSQTNVEKNSEIKREYWSKIETGGLPNPTYRTIVKIAKALRVKASELIAETEGDEPNSKTKLHLTIDELNQIRCDSTKKGRMVERRRLKELI